MSYTDQQLAIDFIKAGLTPRVLEQTAKQTIKSLVQRKGFTMENMVTIFERWDIDGAKDKIRRTKVAEYGKTRSKKP